MLSAANLGWRQIPHNFSRQEQDTLFFSSHESIYECFCSGLTSSAHLKTSSACMWSEYFRPITEEKVSLNLHLLTFVVTGNNVLEIIRGPSAHTTCVCNGTNLGQFLQLLMALEFAQHIHKFCAQACFMLFMEQLANLTWFHSQQPYTCTDNLDNICKCAHKCSSRPTNELEAEFFLQMQVRCEENTHTCAQHSRP